MLEWLSGHSLVLVVILSFLMSFIWLGLCRKKLGINMLTVFLLIIMNLFAGLLSVRAFAVLEAGSIEKAGNISLFGAVFFMPAVYLAEALILRRKVSLFFDMLTPCVVITLLFARMHCLFAGCCSGSEISFWPGHFWPIREAEIVYYLILGAYCIYKIKKGKTGGYLYPLYMESYGIVRFILQYGRAQYMSLGLIHLPHIWAIICIISGAIMLFILKKRREKVK